MNRAVEIWNGQAAVAVRRMVAWLARAFAWLLARLFWQLRVIWAQFSPRARIIFIIIGLVLISAWTGTAIPGLSEAAHGFAVLLVAFIGLWWIITAPFPSRRWW
jgi:hypothetical protein